jgi:hypothetical protein
MTASRVEPAPQAARAGVRAAPGARPGFRRWLTAGLIVIALGLAAVALLGPLIGDVVAYRVTGTFRTQTIGLDAVSVAVVAPLSLFAAVLVRRGHVAGPALALGVGAYTTYMFLQYILGADYAHLPGDNERLFPLYLVLFAAGWLVALGAWSALEDGCRATSRRRDRLIGRVLLPALAFVTFVRYVPAIADAVSPAPGRAYLAGPSFFWAIAMLDLGVLLPAIALTCVGLMRGTGWAQRALYLVVGWLGLVGLAVGGMAIALYVNGDPTVTAASTVLMIVLGLAYAALAVAAYRPLFDRGRRDAGRTAPSRAPERRP